VIAEKLPAMVDEKVGKMVNDILDDVFRGYSDTAKGIKKRIEEGLDVNLQRFDLVDYNAFVADAINKHLAKCMNEGSIEPIMQMVQSTVGFISKKKMKLSEIAEHVKQIAMEDSDEEGGEISFHIEENRQYKWVTVSLDIEEGKSTHNCAVEFLFSTDDGRMFSLKTNTRWCSDRKSISPMRLAQYDKLQHEIFRLYSAQVKIEFDNDYIDTEWYKY
jgi:hypothetical protein